MSASLVGSEMCIRDRAETLGRLGESPGPERPLAPLPTACARAASRGVGPVSYTHLTLPTICSV
eukprot:1114149-Alexandrium_andersonii.AAC.1